ncbi:hypothetical protein G7062_07310 [Erysipelothrix sp. HDW6C]|uniref:hypothetical protein n=1 Tax=Erysipelothrix sp. HDW6C TaxID=2714930 RepID=UPI00140CA909|nr:hypothetical protein [Erysipelothrix sp. HDW6C]QIK70103.1 hypothetical protein G7062_07310 [Erysipelothrix sp. HDW6C]
MCKSNLRVIKTLNAIVESFADEKLMIKYDGERILQKFTIVFWHDASSEQLQTDNLYLQLESIWHRFHFDNLPIFEVFLKAVFLRWRRLVGDDAIVLITLNACVIDCSVIHKKISIFRYTGDVEGLLRELLYVTIKKHIDDWDTIELLCIGAPRDEYDGESREITERILVDDNYSVDTITTIIDTVFLQSFSASVYIQDLEASHRVATLIVNDLTIDRDSECADLQSNFK